MLAQISSEERDGKVSNYLNMDEWTLSEVVDEAAAKTKRNEYGKIGIKTREFRHNVRFK